MTELDKVFGKATDEEMKTYLKVRKKNQNLLGRCWLSWMGY